MNTKLGTTMKRSALIGGVALSVACSSSHKEAEAPEKPDTEAKDDEPGTLEKANQSIDQAHENLKKNIKPVVGPVDEGVKKGVKNAKKAIGAEGDEDDQDNEDEESDSSSDEKKQEPAKEDGGPEGNQ